MNAIASPITQAPPENTFGAAWEAVKAQVAQPAHQLTFWVPSVPKGEMRARHAVGRDGKSRTHKAEKTAEGRQEILMRFELEFPTWQPWLGPVKVDVIDCHVPAGESWPGQHCTKTPDWDNSAKLVGDSLNGFAWRDDKQITLGVPAKTYWHKPGKWVRLSFYHPVAKPLHGRVKHATNPDRHDLWEHGRHFGRLLKQPSGRVYAERLYLDEEGYQLGEPVFDLNHKSQYWGNLSRAEAAVRSEAGL